MFFTANYNFCSLKMSTMVEYGINWTFVMLWTGLYSTYDEISIKIEYIRKLSSFNCQWTKTLYQNNFKHIAIFFTAFVGYNY